MTDNILSWPKLKGSMFTKEQLIRKAMDMSGMSGMGMDTSNLTESQKIKLTSCYYKTTIPHCKISMLWNWYTKDACFLSKSWMTTTRAKFAGSCIGLFCWLVAFCLLHRFIVEYRQNLRAYKIAQLQGQCPSCCNKEEAEVEKAPIPQTPSNSIMAPIMSVFSHSWLYTKPLTDGYGDRQIYLTVPEHIFNTALSVVEWINAFLIMLMWMYYNGYIIITAILGYFFGQLIFSYLPLTSIKRTCCCPKNCEAEKETNTTGSSEVNTKASSSNDDVNAAK